MYIEMFDGLRSYYERRLGTNGSAGFQAAMSLSFLFGICAAALQVLIDAYITGSLQGTMWLYDHKLLIIVFGILTAWAHVRYAKYRNVYDTVGPPMSKSWMPWLVGYCITAGLLSLGAVWTAYLARPHG